MNNIYAELTMELVCVYTSTYEQLTGIANKNYLIFTYDPEMSLAWALSKQTIQPPDQ